MHSEGKRANQSVSSRRGWQRGGAAHHKVAPLIRVPACVASVDRCHTCSPPRLHTPVVALTSSFSLRSLHFEPSAKNQGASRLLSKMLACTEMITMCLQSAKQKHLRAQQQQQPLRTAGQGLTIFHDVSGSTPLLIYSPCDVVLLLQIIPSVPIISPNYNLRLFVSTVKVQIY